MTTFDVLDLFAGPGGWSHGLRSLGLRDLGVEIDRAALATRTAAGHATEPSDVAALDPRDLPATEGLIASPPCQTFSTAGLRAGADDMPLCHAALSDLAAGRDTRAEMRARCADPRSLLVVEPLRYSLARRPRWIALEQVPAALPLFQHTARRLGSVGYSTWTGILNAADHGLPQTRKRCFLIASLDRSALPPEPTHHRAGTPPTLFGPGRLPWVSMRDAIGCPTGDIITRGHHTTGGTRFPTGGPSWALTGRARSWTLRVGNQKRATRRVLDSPAPTLLFGHSLKDVSWHDEHGHKVRRLSVAEAALLQGFPADYPWHGSRTKQFEQIGNAVPPPVAAAVAAAATGTIVPTALRKVAA
ncbi:DNA cytosine methyltransferase [Streptomyces spiramenti]|uniref:DNA (cytosine-5-)-methyltransferase n=1 Tax=Streptomyces spiramenti TaxID=2720606 RepID=A0ABX1AGM4_9ACTN|nr:DNA cytosine methyltransferase [Streptomyces spiramenti]NJP64781.1 DNA cytosine methyltransferase [Streptomyces spiramenti]